MLGTPIWPNMRVPGPRLKNPNAIPDSLELPLQYTDDYPSHRHHQYVTTVVTDTHQSAFEVKKKGDWIQSSFFSNSRKNKFLT